MSIQELGREGETKARLFLKKIGLHDLQQFDWFVKHEGKYFIVEVKHKSLYHGYPFTGTGLDIAQVKRRTQIFEDLGIDTLLLTFEKDTDNVYSAWLSYLEKTNYHDTANKIRIYDIAEFKKTVNT
jgi:hypothetical protein